MKFRIASFWLAAVAVCLYPAQAVWAQSAKAPASASGNSNQSAPIAGNTGCGYSPEAAPSAPNHQQHRSGQSGAKSGQPSLVLISTHDDEDSDDPGIVGLWRFAFTATSPFAGPFDAGYVTWHSDGTELMNSGRAPTTGDFCMGVWKQIGRSKYKLNHFALAWAYDPNTPATAPGTGGADFVGPANIREQITLNPGGNTYHGSFTLIQYEPDGTTIAATITGTVTATRITPD